VTTISCDVFAGGSYGPRATINGQQFIECGVLAGGGLMPDGKIGTAKEVIVLDTWTPAENAEDVDHGHSVKVDLHATSDTVEKEILFDVGQDFEDGGSHSQTKVTGDAVTLASQAPNIDFEDYTLFNTLDNGANPHSWTRLDQKASSNTSIRVSPTDSGNQVVRKTVYNDFLEHRLDDIGSISDAITTVKVYISADDGHCGIFFNTTGAGTAMRGHALSFEAGVSYAQFRRVNDWDSFFGLNSPSVGFTIQNSTWYNIKVWSYKSATHVSCQFKIWTVGSAEPGSWTWGGNDTTYVQEGYLGILAITSVASQSIYFDDFTSEPSPATYYSSGTYTGTVLDVTSVKHYSHCLVSWDETLPANTTATLKCRWREIDSWATLTNGAEIPGGIQRGDHMEAGAAYDELWFKIDLATTDSSATPEIENLRFYFEPVAPEAIEIDLDGDIQCTVANGLLDFWGRNQVSGGATIHAWDDIHVQTDTGRWVTALDKAALIEFNYGGDLVEDIVINFARDWWMESADFAGWYWGMIPLAYDGAPIEIRWNAQEQWTPAGHIYEWVLIDQGIGIHADAWYIVGIPVRNDHPLSLLIAVPNLHDHPLSVQPKGYARDDHQMSMLIQGWQRDDHPFSFLPGIYTINDQPVSVTAAIQYLNDHPLSLVVYGVNQEGSIVVNVIDDNTHQVLLDHGITFS
jgi:hypothetical protein